MKKKIIASIILRFKKVNRLALSGYLFGVIASLVIVLRSDVSYKWTALAISMGFFIVWFYYANKFFNRYKEFKKVLEKDNQVRKANFDYLINCSLNGIEPKPGVYVC